jgi:hypothetical protein
MTNAWTKTIANLGSKVGQTFRSGAYKLVAIEHDGLVVEWTATGKRARVWRSLVEKTAERQARGETIRERSISYTVIIEFFVREALATVVAVVACAQEKAAVAKAAAKDLYASSTFRMARAFAEKVGSWMILSAKHGLLSPDAEIETYDLALPKLPAAERRAWAQKVAEQIEAAVNAVRVRFVVVAGSTYRAAFEAVQVFGSSAVQWDCPVAGFEIGELRGWLAQAVRV